MEKARMIEVFGITGEYLHQHTTGKTSSLPGLALLNEKYFQSFEDTIQTEHIYNQWFTEDNIRTAIGAISQMLKGYKLEKWLDEYPELPVEKKQQKIVGVVMAGNIPLVGFHDFMAVLLSGHKFFGKTSSKDSRLIRIIADIIIDIEPEFSERIQFTEEYLRNADAQIATGSNNSSRYFDYYFRDIPHIIRRNRNSIAIIDENITRDQLVTLGKDIFTYFGMGCRNVTKLYVPEGFDLTRIMEALEDYRDLADHNKYGNNLDYQRTIYLMNRIPFLDNGAVLLRESDQVASPVGVVFYEKYSELDSVLVELGLLKEQIQCVVTTGIAIEGSVQAGDAQFPELWDYADGIDTLKFLTDITR